MCCEKLEVKLICYGFCLVKEMFGKGKGKEIPLQASRGP
jgi:hypothetical protein